MILNLTQKDNITLDTILNDTKEEFEIIRQKFFLIIQKLTISIIKELNLLEEFKEDQINRIYWRQFTPTYNDGDPCTFRIANFSYICDSGEDGYLEDVENNVAYENIDKIIKFFKNNKNLFLLFGQNVEVFIHKNGEITIEDYEPEY